MDNNQVNTGSTLGAVGQVIGRFIAAAVVLAITAFFTPGFSINNIWSLGLAAIILTAMDYLITRFTGLHASPFGKGFVGFILAAVTLYLTQYFVAGYSISWIAAIIGALIYGVIDYIIPGESKM
ncbi:MAG: phage holin family protein [Clostridia bacterium]|nr:phage holin family protein [Clostridia bacterium]